MKQIALVTFIIFIGAAFRFFPHPINFTPVLALALLAGRWLPKSWGMVIPLGAMVLTDALIGFSNVSIFVYAAMGLIFCLGHLVKAPSMMGLAGQSLGAAVLFFLVTNAGVWAVSTIYAPGFEGLIASYVAGIPFFHNSVLSTLIYGFAFEGVYRYAKPRVLEEKSAVAKV